ncbi:MAG: hypothetical protein QXM31_02810 [Candidatus Woesearchaeota archaeon]
MRWNKKGALELSITAIVVLIIAITVLGLAIFFIKNLFKGGTEIFTSELAKIKDTLRKNIEESGELVVMSKGAELEVKRGEKFEFHIGTRNTASKTRCFRIGIVCNKPFGDHDCTPYGNDRLVGGLDEAGSPPAPDEKWFPRLLGEFEVPGNDIGVFPATLQIASADPDTYLMYLNVYQGLVDCEPGIDCCSATDSWNTQTKRFHIILS